MNDLVPCPFCGSDPWFEGSASEWKDDHRYVELTLKCCASMTEAIGWRKARDMTVEARESELKAQLTASWNTRAAAPQAPSGQQAEPFVVKHYSGSERPMLKGNGFDGLEIGEDRDEAEQFVRWINAALAGQQAGQQAEPTDGWKEACIAWTVCGSIHREYAKGKDPFFKTRQGDFTKHEEDARAKALAGQQAEPAGEIVLFGGYKEISWRNGQMPDVGTKLYARNPSERPAPAGQAVGEQALIDLIKRRFPDRANQADYFAAEFFGHPKTAHGEWLASQAEQAEGKPAAQEGGHG